MSAGCIDDNRTEQGTGNIIDGECVSPPDILVKYDCGSNKRLDQGTANTCIDGTKVGNPGVWLPAQAECLPGEGPKQGTGECVDVPN